MSHSSLVTLSAATIALKIRSGELTPTEVVEAHLAAIARHNPRLNAVVTETAQAALDQARDIERRRAAGAPLGLLAGVPVGRGHSADRVVRQWGRQPEFAFAPRTHLDIGARLGCGGHLSALRRTRSGKFTLDRAVTVADLKTAPREDLFKAMISLAEISLMRGV